MRGGENYMRIDPNAKMPEIPESKVTNRSGSSTRSSPSSADHSTDQATLASEQRVQELQKQLAQTSEDRQGRVEALGRAIRNLGRRRELRDLLLDNHQSPNLFRLFV